MLQGYIRRTAERGALFFGSILLVLGLSGLIAWPLWYLATQQRRFFNLACGMAAGVVIFLVVARALGRRSKSGRSRRNHRAAAESKAKPSPGESS